MGKQHKAQSARSNKERIKKRKKKRRKKTMKTILTVTLAVTLLAASANAECANGCSGHGVCGANDMCSCYRNWQGNDCAHRTCPYAFAQTTTPQGDLNLDGDRLDNSGKILSEQGSININTKTITFASSGVVKNTEVKVGDGLKICDETFVITAISCTGSLCTSVTVDHVATKVVNKNSQKVVTCTVAARSKTVKCDANIEGTNSALENDLAPGDYIQLKPFPPMRVNAVSAMTITLDNAISDVVAYGTELYQVHKYGLWDAQKNRACVCDPRWTGDDCSLTKCPRGDDPLTVKSYDEQKNYIKDDQYDVPDSSWYEQRAEKQTLVIDSDKQAAIGHFYLTFTDFYGDEFKTLPIPTEVQLTVSASTSTDPGSQKLTFDGNSAGLPATELTRGDTVRIGADYKRVVTVKYKNTVSDVTKGLYIEEVTLDSAPVHGSGSSGHHNPGTRVFRTDVSKEIREALLNIPNGRIEGVSVEKIDRAGRSIGAGAFNGGTDGQIDFGSDSSAKVGDIIRVKDEITRVESIASDDLTVVTVIAKQGTSDPVFYKQNGAKYRINFESGCEKDSDCNSNGIDSTASDAGAICTLGGTCLCSDKTSTEAYNGKGCRVDGKGNHQRSYIRANSGDIESMKCDKSRLFSGAVADKGANVARVTPTKVVFEAGLTADRAFSVEVGDLIYIDGQVRTVTMVTVDGVPKTTSLTVDEPFKSYGWSDDNFLVPPGSWVYVLDRDGGAGISCTSTDLPPLTSSAVTAGGDMQLYAEKVAISASVQNRSDSVAFRKIELDSSGRVFDDDEIYVGDRIRVFESARKSWETRTVDSIDYVAVTADNEDNEGMISAIYVDSPLKATTGVDLYVDNRGTTEAIECSRRGLCDQTTGVCSCFNGYTGPACNRQDAMFSA